MQKYSKYFYWVESPEHTEDWFVVAPDQYLAEKFFADTKGFDIDNLNSSEVCETIYEDCNEESYYPSLDILKRNGFEFISEDEPMIVWRNGRKFCQGDIIEAIVLRPNASKKGMYIIKVRNSDLYKIGVTTNIVRRKKQFETANPFEFYLHEFFPTEDCRKLEREVHKRYKEKRYKNEWFKLTEEDVLTISNFAREYIGLRPYLNVAVSPLQYIDLGTVNKASTETEENNLPF